MKGLTLLALLVVLSLYLVGCGPKQAGEKVRIKCPACGYEFDAPAKD